MKFLFLAITCLISIFNRKEITLKTVNRKERLFCDRFVYNSLNINISTKRTIFCDHYKKSCLVIPRLISVFRPNGQFFEIKMKFLFLAISRLISIFRPKVCYFEITLEISLFTLYYTFIVKNVIIARK